MTEKSAKMVGVKQPIRITIGEGLTPRGGLQTKHTSAKEEEKADVGCQQKCHGGKTSLLKDEHTVDWEVFYKIGDFIDKYNVFVRQ